MTITKAHAGYYAIAASISLLAGSIFYFSAKLSSLESAAKSLAVYHDVAPELVAGLVKTSNQMPVIVSEVGLIRQQLPELLSEITAVRKLVPVVVEQIPPILAEAAALRENTIPAVLAESSALRKVTIPSVLLESGALRQETIPAVLSESKALRTDSIPSVVNEVKAAREDMPALLAQANEVARTAGQNASEGAVSGFFSGIIKAPINLVTGVGSSVFKGHSLTARDQDLLTNASVRVLEQNQLNASQSWHNPDSNGRGIITLTAMVVSNDERCRELTFQGFSGRRSLGTKVAVICHDEKGVWQLKE